MKKYIQVGDKINTLQRLIQVFGLPEIHNRLNVYGKIGENQIQIEINNQKIGFKISTEYNDFVYINNKRVKYFFKYLYSLGLTKITLGRANIFRFRFKDVLFEYYEDTLIGDFIICRFQKNSEDIAQELAAKCNFELKDRSYFDERINDLNVQEEELFSEFGVLNPNIKNYCADNNIDIRSNSEFLKTRIDNINNDYSFYEKPFKTIASIELLGTQSILNKDYFLSVSIVIPCFRAEKTIKYVLDSIAYQNLSPEQISTIQVILVDDGSEIRLSEVLAQYSYNFEIIVIRLEKNSGRSAARNAGISMIKHDYTLFIDADIVLSKNYILDMITRSKLLQNALFVSFRSRIPDDSPVLEKIKDGLDPGLNPDDSRIFNKSRHDQMGWSSEEIDKQAKIELLDDSNYFKQLSYGGKIGIYSLPSVVSGHNMFTRSSIVKDIGGFSSQFKGWGLEDTYFGTLVISKGNFIIPVLSSSVYHIGFGPRDDDFHKKISELEKNYSIYLNLIENDW